MSPDWRISIGASCTFSSPHSRPYVLRMIGARASRCACVVFGSKETVTHVAFFSVPHLSPRSPVNQYLAPARSTLPESPSRTVTAMFTSQYGYSACLLKQQGPNRIQLQTSTQSAFILQASPDGATATANST